MKKILLLLVALGLAVGTWSAFSRSRAGGERTPVVVERPRPGGVQAILSATPFVLEKAWTHAWRAEKPSFDAGWLVALAVDPALVKPTQLAEPVLYAGTETVERVNHGFESGRVVAIVPSPRTASGGVALDLALTPLWFGEPDLPERVDAPRIARELALARAIGVTPLSVPPPGALLELESRDDLQALTGALVLEHSPAEEDTGRGLLVPPLK